MPKLSCFSPHDKAYVFGTIPTAVETQGGSGRVTLRQWHGDIVDP